MGVKTTRGIAEFVCATRFGDLPREVIEYSKVLALSHVGMTIAGSTMDFGEKVIRHVKGKAAKAEAGVFGAGFQTTTDYAALANGNSSHSTELEDDSFPETMYSCGHWPAAFAMGEKLHRSGQDVLEAMVVGYEVSARLGLAWLPALQTGKGPYGALASFANAASAAKLLRLDVDQTTNALSLAASQASGLRRQTGTGAHLIEAGFAGRNGISAAELAADGFTGTPTILEGKDGFGDVWSNCPDFDLALGDGYRLFQVGIKKYSCCFGTHRNIDAMLDLIQEHQLQWEDVARIEHGINRTAAHNFLNRQQPTSEEDARFSFAHCSVACFFDGKVFLPSFTMEKVNDPRWYEARKKVEVSVDDSLALGTYENYESPVTITMKDGTQFTRLCHTARGGPDNQRFGPKEVLKKYGDCMEFAGTYSNARKDQIAEMALGLDKLPDVSSLSELATYPDAAVRARSYG